MANQNKKNLPLNILYLLSQCIISEFNPSHTQSLVLRSGDTQRQRQNIYLLGFFLAFPEHAEEALIFLLFLIFIFSWCDRSCKKQKIAVEGRLRENLRAKLKGNILLARGNTCASW